MSIFKRLNIYIYDIDDLFKKVNKKVCKYLIKTGLPITFDFSNKDNQKLYLHFFLITICDFIIENPHHCKMLFYSNIYTKDDFRKDLIQKIKTIFGFKIWEGIWQHSEFLQLLKNNHVNLVDKFELFVQEESKPKSFKHIKKYLKKEGFRELDDTYFKDLAKKMVVCG